MNHKSQSTPGYYTQESCDLNAFRDLCQDQLRADQCPSATDITNNIPVYDFAKIKPLITQSDTRAGLFAEWANLLRDLSGVVVIKGAYPDRSIIDAASNAFEAIIAAEKQGDAQVHDHFAKAGSNDRIWNSLQKLCQYDAGLFVEYHANIAIDAVCEAWLGPGYQMTAQVNLVYPGGQAQKAHRDYHLGFLSAERAALYPAHVHHLSPFLTLQGGIAHCDMPIESGPTKLLPFSQKYKPGYSAYHLDSFRDYFEENYVQLPLSKGDLIFFNPALFHAAGENKSQDIHRMVNLLQVSSAFGIAMETIDRDYMSRAIFPQLTQAWRAGQLDEMALRAAIAAAADGYSFPTNLDTDPPTGGLAPQTQHALLTQAVIDDISEDELDRLLAAQRAKRGAWG